MFSFSDSIFKQFYLLIADKPVFQKLVLKFNLMKKADKQQNHNERGEKEIGKLGRLKQWLFTRNYSLISSLKLTTPQGIFLTIIEQIQRISIITRYSVNPTLLNSPEMAIIDETSKLLLFDVFPVEPNDNLILTCLLIFAQIQILLVYLVAFKGELINQVLSKWIVTFLQAITAIPSIILSLHLIINGINIAPNIVLYILAILSSSISQSMQIQCSFEKQNSNLLVRSPQPISIKIVHLAIISLFPFFNHFLPSISFLLYVLIMLFVDIYCWIEYLFKFIYFHEIFMHAKGVVLSISISANGCYLIIYVLDNAIISHNVLLFISTFSIFLGNFFITYRRYILKNVIINKDLKGEHQIALYCIFYWHCFTLITQKKNQLYISSLLKNHTNQCLDVNCCCKNRQNLFDNELKIFGNPSIQPHFDKIFIRHFIRKLLSDGYKKFPKSSILAYLLSTYNLQVLEMVTQTMQLMRTLKKLTQKRSLHLTEKYLFYCLNTKTKKKIIDMNFSRGNLDLQSVQEFNEQLILLNDNLKISIRMYNNLWKELQNTKLNESVLYNICKNNLELMFKIELNYKKLKFINSQSNQLKAIMIFYSKMVLHDIHMLSQVKKDIKSTNNKDNSKQSIQSMTIKLFSENTATIISLQDSRIKWASKNSHKIFDYPKDEFHSLNIKQLMPKYFAQRHDGYIQRWKRTGHQIKLNKTNYLWGSTKSGVCFGMLIFAKVVPFHEQDYAFFTSIQKLDDDSEIICSSYGQIYGAGKLFSKTLCVNPKYIQQMRMNIQVFLPSSFDHFLQYFYPKNMKLKPKKNAQVRRQGYFPHNIEQVIKVLNQQRGLFIKRHGNSESFALQYLAFIRQQMQQLSCNIEGEYISFSLSSLKVPVFEKEGEHIVVLRASNPKKDNIDRYYTELQKMITKLQSLSEDNSNKYSKTTFGAKKSKHDFFRAFLNPKRIKRLLREEQESQLQHENPMQSEQIHKQRSIEPIVKVKSPQMLVAHRKRLALGARLQIKNDRVRYNIFKIKKILFQQGIISRFTYNLLIGKSNITKIKSDINMSMGSFGKNEGSLSLKTIEIPKQDLKQDSDEEKQSIQDNSDNQFTSKKQNDNETFNSAASSATFISMTNHVKLFKLKLRSLNTPKPLLILNLLILTVVLFFAIGLISFTTQNITNLYTGLLQFKNNQQANSILDSLYLGQLNILYLNNDPLNANFLAQKSHYLSYTSNMFKNQMLLRARYKKIDNNLLRYLTLIVIDDQVLTIRQFIEVILDQIATDTFAHVMIYYTESKEEITKSSIQNLFFIKVQNSFFILFIVYLLITITVLIISFPIVYRLNLKIKEIYRLLNKISKPQKQRYHRHFASLNEQFKKNNDKSYGELINMASTYEQSRYSKNIGTKIFSEQSHKAELLKKEQKISISQNESDSADHNIYAKILVIFIIVIGSTVLNFVYLSVCHRDFMDANDKFIDIFNSKTLLTSRIIEGQYELMGFPMESEYSSTSIELTQAIFTAFKIKAISPYFKKYLFDFVTGQPCNTIQQQITEQEFKQCQIVNNQTFSQGALDNLYYTQRKIEERVTLYYIARNFTPNIQQEVSFSQFFSTQEFVELNIGYYFSTLMVNDLYVKIHEQMSRFEGNYRLQFIIILVVCLLLIILFVVLWLSIYLKLAENASYINAFLLLIPFDVLTQNPYVKLYIKNEFDYKAAY